VQLYLTDDEKKMRDGHLGEAQSMAMSILVDLGEAINAPEMAEITHVHTDSGIGCGRQNRTKASSMATIVKCRPLVAGHGRGKILITQQNISFWGGVDPLNGMIIDPRHELFDQSIPGRILAFPYGKGSAAAPLVLLELAKQTTAPAAIINIETGRCWWPALSLASIFMVHHSRWSLWPGQPLTGFKRVRPRLLMALKAKLSSVDDALDAERKTLPMLD
jgi:predicted aconitase with swiveling domain